MDRIYIVTGANGHLGGTIVRMLRRAGAAVRGLVLPAEKVADAGAVRYFKGDVRDKASLEPLFADTDGRDVVVIHTAGIVDIADKVSPAMYLSLIHI